MFVYLITNTVNGKRYVGKTRRNDPNIRWKEHLAYAREEKPVLTVSRAINEYGPQSFTFEILESECETEEQLSRLEQFWIDRLDLINPQKGYNASKGGECGAFVVDQQRRSLATQQTWLNPTIRQKRIAGLRRGYNRHTSEEKAIIREKISAGNKAQFADPEKRARHQLGCKLAKRFVGWTAAERKAAMGRDVSGSKNPAWKGRLQNVGNARQKGDSL